MQLYADKATARLRYVLLFMTEYCWRENVNLITEADKVNPDELLIWYSIQTPPPHAFVIIPHGLLEEQGVRSIHLTTAKQNQWPILFPNEGGHCSFDIFSAIFFLLSRYEEYLPYTADEYGRFPANASWLYQQKVLQEPLIELWLQQFQQQLIAHNNKWQCIDRVFKFIPTYDIDIAWSFWNKPWQKRMGGFFKRMSEGSFNQAWQQLKVRAGVARDPFHSYDVMDQWHEQYQLKPIFFFLVAKHEGLYDKNIARTQSPFRKLIRRHSRKYMVGLHPSYQSHLQPQVVKEEKRWMEKITRQVISRSRQHYIKMNLPDTYELLLQIGISEDYSMGYGTVNGFRAGTSLPFYWYNLREEKVTPLRIFPYCFMDANAFYEGKLIAAEALQELKQFVDKLKSVNGYCITLWHNNFLGTDPQFEGWNEAYASFLQYVNG